MGMVRAMKSLALAAALIAVLGGCSKKKEDAAGSAERDFTQSLGIAASGAKSGCGKLDRAAFRTFGAVQPDVLAFFSFPEHVRNVGSTVFPAHVLSGFPVEGVAAVRGAVCFQRRLNLQRTDHPEQERIRAIAGCNCENQVARFGRP